MRQLTESLYVCEDTCNVYMIRKGSAAILIDFGSGGILEHLQEAGITQVVAVLMTHHHRDQGQGLQQAVEAGIPIWVPQAEQDLFRYVNEHWQAREIYNNYNVREDRFSLLESVPVAGTLNDYASYSFGGIQVKVVPTPGHTMGSVTLLVQSDGRRLAFTGDLIHSPGRVWTISSTQWTYIGAEGVTASMLSLLDLKERRPDLLLPSHGEPMPDPAAAIDLLVDHFQQLQLVRDRDPYFVRMRDEPFEEITPHLLMNRTSFSNSYVLLSASGKALLIDYGYDFQIGAFAAGAERSARRPWLYNIETLKKQYGVHKIDVVLPTHYHDDHVAGFNLLREVEGTEVWAAEHFADLLEQPSRYDLPCLWYDPIPVARRLPLGKPFRWEEYEFTLYEQGGHTMYAAAISFSVDGHRILAIGDQQENSGNLWNYVYKNRFRMGDYAASGQLYLKLAPQIMLTGHWGYRHIETGYLEQLLASGEKLERAHRQLLPLDSLNLGEEGFCARMYPYQLTALRGEKIFLEVEVTNPGNAEEAIQVLLVFPQHWNLPEHQAHIRLQPQAEGKVAFHIQLPDVNPVRRARVGAEITVGAARLGQQAEMLVTIL